MLLRALRLATTTAASTASTVTKQSHSHLSISRPFSANTTKSNLTKAKRSKPKSDGKDRAEELQVTDTEFFVKQNEENRLRQLAEDENNPALDVGTNGRPLFTSTPSLSLLTRKDACSYMKFSMEELNEVLPEGLPMGMVKEFEESSKSALLIRQNFLDLRDNFRRTVDPSLSVP